MLLSIFTFCFQLKVAADSKLRFLTASIQFVIRQSTLQTYQINLLNPFSDKKD